MSDKITNDFEKNLEKIKDFIRAYGIDWKEFDQYRHEIYYELKSKTNIFNYENITGISCNKNTKRRLFVHSTHVDDKPD